MKLGQNWPKWHKLRENFLKVCESMWRSLWKCVKISQLNSPAQVHTFRHPTCWNWAKIAQIAWKCESVWRSLWKCVKVSPLNSPAWVHTFRHPTCWNWAKIAWIVWTLRESVWKRVKESVKLWKYHYWIPRLEYILLDTQKLFEIGPKLLKLVQIGPKLHESAWRSLWKSGLEKTRFKKKTSFLFLLGFISFFWGVLF